MNAPRFIYKVEPLHDQGNKKLYTTLEMDNGKFSEEWGFYSEDKIHCSTGIFSYRNVWLYQSLKNWFDATCSFLQTYANQKNFEAARANGYRSFGDWCLSRPDDCKPQLNFDSAIYEQIRKMKMAKEDLKNSFHQTHMAQAFQTASLVAKLCQKFESTIPKDAPPIDAQLKYFLQTIATAAANQKNSITKFSETIQNEQRTANSEDPKASEGESKEIRKDQPKHASSH